MKSPRNLLEILNVGDPELLSASVLAWLLDPSAEHGQGSIVVASVARRLSARGEGWLNAAIDRKAGIHATERRHNGRCEVVLSADGRQLILVQASDVPLSAKVLAQRGPDVAALGLTEASFDASVLASYPTWTWGEALPLVGEATDGPTHFLRQFQEHVLAQIDAAASGPAPAAPPTRKAEGKTEGKAEAPPRPTGMISGRRMILNASIEQLVEQGAPPASKEEPTDQAWNLKAEMLLSDDMSRAYLIEDKIGAGGQGLVYGIKITGEQDFEGFTKPVAKAVMKIARPGQQEALLREREIYGQPDRGIIKLLDSGKVRGRPYLVLEHLQLHPFERFKGRVDLATAIDTFMNLAEILQWIHTRKGSPLILCDIKPANIMVRMSCPEGIPSKEEYLRRIASGAYEPVFMDMGCAQYRKQLRKANGQIPTLIGTPAYLPPESVPELRGQKLVAGAYSARTDVYALTLSLYEYLTGKRPYEHRGLYELHGRDQLLELLDYKRERVSPFHLPYLNEHVDKRTADTLAGVLKVGLAPNPAKRATLRELLETCGKEFQVKKRVKLELSDYKFDAVKGLRVWQTRDTRIDPADNLYLKR